jgi:ADP-heptose:LPS heptosyltransferase
LCGNIIWKDLAETFDRNVIDDFIWINRKLFLHNFFYKYSILKMIYERGFEVAIDTIYSREILFGDIIIKAAGAKERIGSRIVEKFSKYKKSIFSDRFYTKLIPVSESILFEFERNKEFFSNLLEKEIAVKKPSIDTLNIPSLKNTGKKYVVIIPGASRKNKMWSSNNFRKVAEYVLEKYPFNIIVSGSRQEEYLFGNIIPKGFEDRFINYFGCTLSVFAKLISEAELVISNDTSAVHFAAASDIPFICIADGFHYGRFYPYPENIFAKGHYLFPRNFTPGKENNLMEIPPEEVKNLLKDIVDYS